LLLIRHVSAQAPENYAEAAALAPSPTASGGQARGIACGFLECYYAMNTIGAEDAELAFVITAEIDETAVPLSGAG
jgi:hypothetical protein